MIDIYKFTCLSKFLCAVLKQKQKSNHRYSLRLLSKKIGISAPTLSLAINKKTNLSRIGIENISNYLKLLKQEKEYLFLLRDYQRSEGQIKIDILKRIKIIQSDKRNLHISTNKLPYRYSWEYMLAIVAVSFCHNQTVVKNKLQDWLGMTSIQVTSILQELINTGFIEESENHIDSTTSNIVFDPDDLNIQLKKIHANYAKFSSKMIQEKDTDERYSVTEFISIPQKKMNIVKNITNDYLNLLSQVSERDESDDSVIGVSLHLNLFK